MVCKRRGTQIYISYIQFYIGDLYIKYKSLFLMALLVLGLWSFLSVWEFILYFSWFNLIISLCDLIIIIMLLILYFVVNITFGKISPFSNFPFFLLFSPYNLLITTLIIFIYYYFLFTLIKWHKSTFEI